jgi:hypothetical protein
VQCRLTPALRAINGLLELQVKDGSTLILGADPSGLWLVHEVPDVSPQPRPHPVAGHLCFVQPVWIGMTDRPEGAGYTSYSPLRKSTDASTAGS